MPTYTDTGIQPYSLADYVDRLVAVFRQVLGDDMSVAPSSPQMQIIGALALALAESDEAVVRTAAGLNLHQASGRQLDDWGTILGLTRRAATHSTVVLTLSGVAGTGVPAGSRVRNAAGAVFATDTTAIISAGGSVDVPASATALGAIHAPAGSLTQLQDVIAGWLGATNAQDADVGLPAESDAEYRRRYLAQTSLAARDSLEAIRSRLLTVPGVRAAVVRDNPTASPLLLRDLRTAGHRFGFDRAGVGFDQHPFARASIAIPAWSILAIVQGGDDTAIATAIAQSKPVGIPTTGAQRIPAATPGRDAISFTRATLERVLVSITTTITAGFPADGIAQIQQRVADWSVGAWVSRPGDFDTTGLSIGESIPVARLYTPANSVPGHIITSLAVTDAAGDPLPVPPLPYILYTILPADVAVAVI